MGHTLSKEQANLALAYSYDEARNNEPTTNTSCTSIVLSPQLTDSPQRFYNLDLPAAAASHLKRSYTLSGLSSQNDSAYSSSDDLLATPEVPEVPEVVAASTTRVSEELLRDLAYVNRTYYPLIFSDRGDDDDNDGARRQKIEDMVNDIVGEHEEFERQADPRWKRVCFGAVMQSHNNQIDLSFGSIVSLSPNIGLLYSITQLKLSNNRLATLPRTLGHLKNLTVLDVSQNRLRLIPDTISYLSKLVDLNLAGNHLTRLPDSIGSLKKLSNLLLNDNKISELPSEIGHMKGLTILDLCNNPLKVLPAELSRLQFLRRLRLDNCPLVEEFVHELVHNPPTLLELCARAIVRHQVPILACTPDDIKDYIASAKTCSFCSGPYFQSFVKRGKIIEKPEQAFVPLEYRLCTAHWNDEAERIRLMFAPAPETAPPAAFGPKGRRFRTNPAKPKKAAEANMPEPPSPSTSAEPRRRGSMSVTPSPQTTVPISSLAKKPALPTLVVKRPVHVTINLPANFIPDTSSSSSSASSVVSTPVSETPEAEAPNISSTGFGRWRTGSIRRAMSRSNSGLLQLGEKLGFAHHHPERQQRTV
ncbi:hypothetical protein BC938DRAFT_470623 [Jimgerdemannia flammicorona]|uniref:L domain-like protein n=1 Tax=Jimgerdemannia flammicorona TaxID=994334 RepID=A0A433Q9Z3_9FUNG|nr:hypothetical protein BC938DRAFT_470623 [Jimgerdemannia flammicorona]